MIDPGKYLLQKVSTEPVRIVHSHMFFRVCAEDVVVNLVEVYANQIKGMEEAE